MKAKWMLLKIFLGMIVLIFLVSFSAKRHACKPIAGIDVEIDHESGKFFVNDSLVKKIVQGKQLNVQNVPLGNMDISRIEHILNRNSFIRKSQVYQDVDGVMKISIDQETPLARINTGVDEYYLSDELTKIPLSSLYAAEVLLVGGNIMDEDFEGLKNLVQYISADKLLKKHIIAVKKDKPNSFILLVNKGNYVIEFGELVRFKEKFDKLKLFYDQYLGKVGLNYYQKLNLRYKNQVVATKRINDEK